MLLRKCYIWIINFHSNYKTNCILISQDKVYCNVTECQTSLLHSWGSVFLCVCTRSAHTHRHVNPALTSFPPVNLFLQIPPLPVVGLKPVLAPDASHPLVCCISVQLLDVLIKTDEISMYSMYNVLNASSCLRRERADPCCPEDEGDGSPSTWRTDSTRRCWRPSTWTSMIWRHRSS